MYGCIENALQGLVGALKPLCMLHNGLLSVDRIQDSNIQDTGMLHNFNSYNTGKTGHNAQ